MDECDRRSALAGSRYGGSSNSSDLSMSEKLHPESLTQYQLLDIVADAISGAFLVFDRNDVIVYVSANLRYFLPVLANPPAPGMRLRDLLGAIHDHGGYFPNKADPRHRPQVSREDWIAGEIASLWKERSESVERRGPDRWMSLSRRRFPSGHGVCVFRDVSEHRKREDQWRADLERVQLTEEILENFPFAVVVKDRNLTWVGMNRLCSALHCKPADALLGRATREIFAPELADKIDAADRHVLETGEPFHIAEQVVRPDGTTTAMMTRKFRVGKPGRYLVVTTMEDLSELFDMGVAGEVLFQGLEGLDFSKADMRTMQETAAASSAVSKSQMAGRHVLLVTGNAELEASVIASLLACGVDATAARDEPELEAILDAASQAGLTIDLIAIDSDLDFSCLELAEASGHDVLVFDPFQAERDLPSKITRHLLRPRAESFAEEHEARWQVTGDNGVDVLVAEDNAVNRIVFQQILEGFGYRYVLASDGEEAVRLWRELDPGIILMDVTLPKLNGFEAASKIRETEEIPGRTPIIGVLSPAVEGDRDACWAAGMDDVVLKPLSPDILEEKFRKFLTNKQRMARKSG